MSGFTPMIAADYYRYLFKTIKLPLFSCKKRDSRVSDYKVIIGAKIIDTLDY